MTAQAKREAPVRLEVSRRLDAPPELVFDAWLDPDSVCKWLFATPGGVMKRVEIDARVGGRFRIDEQRGESVAEHFGEYLEIDRPRRLVFSFAVDREEAPTIVTVEIVPDRGGSLLTLTHEMEAKWADYADRMREGWTMIVEGLATTLADAYTLTLTRLIDAPRSLVWRAWTEPEHARHWGPKGFKVEAVTEEVRVGAPWRVCLSPEDGGRDLWQGGVYREVVEPERLAFTFAWDNEDGTPGQEMLVTLTLEEHDGKTKLTLHQTGFPTVAERDGHAVGWGEALDALAAHAAAMRT